MKKQIFTIILLLMGGISTFGQFKFDGGTNSVRLQTNGVDRVYIQPAGINANTGSIGINTTTPDAKLTINGDMSFKNITRFTVNGGYTATNRNGASVLIFEAGGVLNGIAGGVDGMLLYVLCGYKMPTTTATGALIIKHEESINETVAINRIMTHTGADFTITNGVGGVMMVYDGGRQRWRIMEVTSGSGSFSGWGLTGNSGSNPTTDFIGTTDAQPLAFKTNNVERMRVLTNGRVGIGTVTPASLLHTFIGDAGSVSPRTGTIGTLETNSSTGYLSILTPNTAQSGVAFGSPDGNADGSINYNHSTQKLTLNTKAATRMTIDSVGNIGIADTSPEVNLDVAGAVHIQRDLLLKERLLQPSASASYDPFDRQDKSFVTIEPSTNVTTTIRGFSLPTTPSTFGTVLYVSNGSTGSIVLKHDNATVTNERIITNTGADVTITGRGGAILIYDFTGWRLIAYAQ
jgi:hypothetical protein